MAEDEDKLDVELAIRVLAHEVAEAKVQAFYLENQMLEKAKESGDDKGFERRYNEWFNKEVTRERSGILGTIGLSDDDD